MIILRGGDIELALNPRMGASIVGAKWRGRDIFRPCLHPGATVLDAACFPLVPFSNRIAGSAFSWQDRKVQLRPNHPGDPSSPAIHGIGWLREWDELEVTQSSARLGFEHPGEGGWPFSFRAVQTCEVGEDRIDMHLSLTNLEDIDVPAGLGFHPYFPRNGKTMLRGLHRGEWQNDAHCIPMALSERPEPVDWWAGRPVDTRTVDTVYTDRSGSLRIEWPESSLGVEIEPSKDLSFTTIYVPKNESFFCVEPVSHMTDAVNRSRPDSGLRVLAPGETWAVSMALQPFEL